MPPYTKGANQHESLELQKLFASQIQKLPETNVTGAFLLPPVYQLVTTGVAKVDSRMFTL
jgi:hypothetical protein